MSATLPVNAVDMIATRPRGGWFAVMADFCRRRPLGAMGAVVVVLMIAVALTAPLIAPYDPLAIDFSAMLAAPSATHWLGTDSFGRDVLSRIMYGAKTALIVGLGAAFVGATAGGVIGVGSAYFGGKIDLAMQRIMDIFISFPLIILALAMVAILGNSLPNPKPTNSAAPNE